MRGEISPLNYNLNFIKMPLVEKTSKPAKSKNRSVKIVGIENKELAKKKGYDLLEIGKEYLVGEETAKVLIAKKVAKKAGSAE